MESCKIGFDLHSTNEPLEARVRFDDQVIFDGPVSTTRIPVQHEFDDTTASLHSVTIELYGKTPQHTKINDHGEITQDSLLTVSAFQIDDIELKHLFFQRCVYHHDHNDTSDPVDHGFWGDMGCNGIVTFEFSSPVYLWLLENL